MLTLTKASRLSDLDLDSVSDKEIRRGEGDGQVGSKEDEREGPAEMVPA